MNETNLYDLVEMNSPDAVLDEVLTVLRLISPDYNVAPVTTAFTTTVDLYEGRYPGYKACNTGYHDLNHITDTFLAMARLIHGAVIDGDSLSNREIAIGLTASLLHDTGYIQEEHDNQGTGSKYTTIHVERSMDFFKIYGIQHDFLEEEIAAGQSMILCTDLSVDISTITFPSITVELLGKMLGAADLLAQMSDRKYLEKLLFLYYEFKEGMVDGYESEADILRKTVGFYDFIANRIETTLDGVDRFIVPHLAARWNIHVNLYHEAIQSQKDYLLQILAIPDSDPRDHLRREKIVDKVRSEYKRVG
ncbi:MAG: hypothetical protein ISR62_00340 [Desulfobacteraceae bacterium]|nr:hypothetical protein [Desulfobacterales bacterium]MBL6966859.1 hypothetical protein [Desulfobacteraceae bacterium]MBL7101918.1 hypothetical protein [Desulfobacteraceae bacterium]MBL7171878.1 hypothetical protein [Desulfobacteraceae bacterium]